MLPGFIQPKLCKIQRLLKATPTVFKDYKFMKNLDLNIKNSTFEMLDSDNKEISIGKLV